LKTEPKEEMSAIPTIILSVSAFQPGNNCAFRS